MIRRVGLAAGGVGVVAAGWLVAVAVGPPGPVFALLLQRTLRARISRLRDGNTAP